MESAIELMARQTARKGIGRFATAPRCNCDKPRKFIRRGNKVSRRWLLEHRAFL